VGEARPQSVADPVLVIDTREKLPYAFEGAITKMLRAGDYSVVGYEDRVAVERKSKADAYSSLGAARSRFQRELERLARLDFAAIVIECSLPELLEPPPFSQTHPRAVIGTLLGWSVRYRILVVFAGDRDHAQAVTRHLLTKFAFYAQEGTLVGR
jgi:ERCC4-type nuclease